MFGNTLDRLLSSKPQSAHFIPNFPPQTPHAEPIRSVLRIVWTNLEGQQTVIAETSEAYRVLETSQVFYFIAIILDRV